MRMKKGERQEKKRLRMNEGQRQEEKSYCLYEDTCAGHLGLQLDGLAGDYGLLVV